MKFFLRSSAITILFAMVFESYGWGQSVTLEIEVEGTAYLMDTTDWSKIARSPQMTPIAPPPPNFVSFVTINDVVRVNGQPARGTNVIHGFDVRMRPNPTPGISIADTTRNNFSISQIEIQDADGNDVGTLSLQGFFGGAAPPGADSLLFSNLTVVGGTGAFFGARGQVTHTAVVRPPGARAPASIAEDPSMRRNYGAATGYRYVIQLIPHSLPVIEAIYHSDFRPVTQANPAQRGETLIVRAKGNLPFAGTIFGAPSPQVPALIATPVEVLISGRSAPVLNKIAWPETSDGFRVDFRVPDDVSSEFDLRLSTAWMTGSSFRVPVR